MHRALTARAPQRTHVMSVFSAAIESDMSTGTPGPKISAVTHAHNCLTALEDGQLERFPDFKSQRMREAYRRDPEGTECGYDGRSFVGSVFEFQFLQFARQRIASPTEQLGCLLAVPVGMRKRDADHRAFEVRQRVIEQAL